MAGRQSVMGQTVATGSSAIGFALRTVIIQEVDAANNLCRTVDKQTYEMIQVGLNKRGDSAVWPQSGELWLLDRSMGHWSLKCKITPTSPPAITGSQSAMGTGTVALIALLAQQGILTDSTVPPATPTGIWNPVASYANGWVAGSSVNPTHDAPIRFQLLPGGSHVELNGCLHGGTSINYTTMFYLPAPYIPLYDQTLPCFREDNGSTYWVKVQGTSEAGGGGLVQIISGSLTNITGVSLQVAGTYPLT